MRSKAICVDFSRDDSKRDEVRAPTWLVEGRHLPARRRRAKRSGSFVNSFQQEVSPISWAGRAEVLQQYFVEPKVLVHTMWHPHQIIFPCADNCLPAVEYASGA